MEQVALNTIFYLTAQPEIKLIVAIIAESYNIGHVMMWACAISQIDFIWSIETAPSRREF